MHCHLSSERDNPPFVFSLSSSMTNNNELKIVYPNTKRSLTEGRDSTK
ncbi:Uncharacterized protein APZ42_023019 [Daphnia magna]|uniref:Uncharacterized protein n=1 Tax=Daphnia magna TaxID=35525 RepID=A0A164VA74_9CRUS|nr:Uncharacterized protein APZ42_023019 [Daphnia magna]